MYRQRHILSFVVILALMSGVVRAQQESETLPSTTVPPLSAEALDVLVAGIAFYPDETIEQALAASLDPAGVREIAQLPAEVYRQQLAHIPSSLRFLRDREPELLAQMNQHLSVTARLGLAVRTQLEDVWAAVDRVRAAYAASLEASGEEPLPETGGGTASPGGTSTGTYPVPYGYGAAFAAGWIADDVIEELYGVNTATSTTTYIGPHGGTATTTGGTTVYQNGITTIAAGSESATVQGPGGTTTEIQAQGAAGMTTSGDITYFGSNGSGSISTNNGFSASGSHAGGGNVTAGSDGSTTFDRAGNTSVSSSYGSTQAEHSGSGGVNADGSGYYQGSTNIDSTHGDATVQTQAGGGQATTTVTTEAGQQTFTAGDGQVGQPDTTDRTSATQRTQAASEGQFSTRRPSTTRSSTSQWLESLPNLQRQAARQSLGQTWGQLDSRAGQLSSGQSRFSTGRVTTSRPSGTLRTTPNTRSRPTYSTPRSGRQSVSSPTRSGRRGGGRGGRR